MANRWAAMLCAALALVLAVPASAGASLTVQEMFALADRSVARGNANLAETILRTVTHNPDVHVRSEARFRLAHILAGRHRLADAAQLYRAILDEQPSAQPVRLELARILDQLGDEAGARRALRAVQAGNLPPAVARFVDRWSAALRARKPFGTSFEIAIAPDSNINRATSSSTLGTVIGDFSLNRDAQRRSGIGTALQGQAYARLPLGKEINLLGRITGSADLYRHHHFNSSSLLISAGPEISSGADRLTTNVNAGLYRFGGRTYATTIGAQINYLHPLDRRSQLRLDAALDRVSNRVNRLEDGKNLSLSLSYERALSDRMGIALTLAANRQQRRDPGYATTGGQATLVVYRELGAVTAIASLTYGRLRADDRLILYPTRRNDTLVRASLGAEFRRLKLGGLAPLVRVIVERTRSSIALYDYHRVRTEFGFARAF